MVKELDLNVSEQITFPEAISFTQSLLKKISSGEVNEAQIEEAISTLVQTKEGARGFFVSYLTDESNLPDNPTVAVVNALKSSPIIVTELLVKNLAMSTAMAITHRRNQDEENALGSERVSKRTINLIRGLNMPMIKEELASLKQSIIAQSGKYQDFLERWGYDEVQRTQIKQVIEKIFSDS